MTQYIPIKVNSLSFLTGNGESIEVVDKQNRAHIFCNTSEAGIHYCNVEGPKRKMETIRWSDTSKFTFRVVKALSQKAEKYKGKCLMGCEFVEKLEDIKRAIQPHSMRDIPSAAQEPIGFIRIKVLWSDSLAPSWTVLHCFYDQKYMETNKDKILTKLEEIGVSASYCTN